MTELRNLQRSDDDQAESQKICGSIQNVWGGFFSLVQIDDSKIFINSVEKI